MSDCLCTFVALAFLTRQVKSRMISLHFRIREANRGLLVIPRVGCAPDLRCYNKPTN
jgi:hypothetical protein